MAYRKKSKSQVYGWIIIDGSVKDLFFSDGKLYKTIREFIILQYKGWKSNSYTIFEQRLDKTWNVMIGHVENK